MEKLIFSFLISQDSSHSVMGKQRSNQKEIFEDRKEIITEIENEVSSFLKRFFTFSISYTDFDFQQADTLFMHGLVIINYEGESQFSDSVLEHISSLIQNILKERIHTVNSLLSVQIRPVSLQDNRESTAQATNEIPENAKFIEFFSRAPAKVLFWSLLYLTIFNLVLILGGNFYSGIKVISVQEKYEEAQTKLAEIKARFDSAEQSLKSAKVDYQLSSLELDKIKNEVIDKKNEIIKGLNSDTVNIKNDLRNLYFNISVASRSVDSLQVGATNQRQALKELTESINQLKTEHVIFGIADVVNHSSWDLKIIIFACPVLLLLILLLYIWVHFIRK